MLFFMTDAVRANRLIVRLLASLVPACAISLTLPVPGWAESPGSHNPPVDSNVVDSYRPPASPYGSGNRGIDYDTSPGQQVYASADGEVTFASKIGSGTHVVILHSNGIRTSYSFLLGATVARGDKVKQGDLVGVAGEQFHFGARAGDNYFDPTTLFTNGELPQISLIPIEQRSSQSEAKELQGLLRSLGNAIFGEISNGIGASGDALVWLREGVADSAKVAWTLTEWVSAVGWEYAYGEIMNFALQAQLGAYYVNQFSVMPLHFIEQTRRTWRYQQSQKNCTPKEVQVPKPPAERRIMIMVNGLESQGGSGGLRGLRPNDLGYSESEVIEFSYNGGRSPGVGQAQEIETNDYDKSDTHGDLRDRAEQLNELLIDVRAANPGVPVDIVAHSQGGIVARLALGNEGDAFDPRLPNVENLITLGTPHHGSDLATATAFISTTSIGGVALDGIDALPFTPEHNATSVTQLSEISPLIKELKKRPMPKNTKVTSIAAEGDLIVSSMNSSLEGATNVMVPLYGVGAHGHLPSSSEARREVALALAGMGPTCRAVAPGALLGTGISLITDLGGAAIGGGIIYGETKGKTRVIPDSADAARLAQKAYETFPYRKKETP